MVLEVFQQEGHGKNSFMRKHSCCCNEQKRNICQNIHIIYTWQGKFYSYNRMNTNVRHEQNMAAQRVRVILFFFLSNQVFSKIVHKGIRYSCLYQVRIIGGAMHLPKDEPGSDSP